MEKGDMGRVRYRKSERDLRGEPVSALDSRECTVRSIRCVYETDAEVAQTVVPKPLEASLGSEVCVRFESVSTRLAGGLIRETRSARFGVHVEYDARPGSYLLVASMSSEESVRLGRERYGEPGKIAALEFDQTENSLRASAIRMGVRFLSVQARRVESLGRSKKTDVEYCFKAFPSCVAGDCFDQDPQLVRIERRYKNTNVWRLEGGLALADSPFDPVADFPVRRIVALEYAEGRVEISGRILRPVPGEWLLPFMHQGHDEPAVEGIEV